MDAGTRARSASGSIAEKVRKVRRDNVLGDMCESLSFCVFRKFSGEIYTPNQGVAMPLRIADKISRQKYEKPSHDYLKRRLQQGRVHIAVPDVGNHR